jgi:hypothetical protein
MKSGIQESVVLQDVRTIIMVGGQKVNECPLRSSDRASRMTSMGGKQASMRQARYARSPLISTTGSGRPD